MSSETPERKPDAFKYWAFICYSHSDEKWATWLHRKLETFSVPQRLVGQMGSSGVVIPKRPFPIFRDREELPGSANLTESIERALRDSLYLIVICSPRAVQSKWVDQEIRMFKSWDREDRVLCLVIEGEPNAVSHPELGQLECLPESVKYWIDPNRKITAVPTEPIAADARKGKDGKQNGFLKIAAGILGVSFEDLRQRDEERRHRVRMTYGVAAVALFLILLTLSAELYIQKNTAVEAERKAVASLGIAQRAQADTKAALDERSAALEQQRIATEKEKKASKEAKEAAEKERVAREQEAQQRKEAERLRIQAEHDRELATKAEEEAKKAADEAKRNEQKVRSTLAVSDFASASRLIEENDNGKAMAYLSRALRADPENPSVTTRLVSLLSQRNWPIQTIAPLKHDGEVRSVLYSPEGTRLVTVCKNAAQLWDANSGKAVFPPLEHKAAINSVEFSADGKWLITASQDNTAQMWDVATGKVVGVTFKHDDWVNSASFSTDGKFVVTASQDKIARVWERETGKIVVSLQHDSPLKSAKFSPDGTRLVVATVRSYARLWDVNAGIPIGGNMTHEGGMTTAIFSPNGKWIATSGVRTARIWNAEDVSPVSAPLDHVSWINGAKFSPDGKYLATISTDNTARIWEVPNGKAVTPPLKHDGSISGVNFSPNGRWLITASTDGTARIWSAATGKPVCEPLRHVGAVFEAAFNYNGDKVVTASADRSARIWQVADNRPVCEPLRHDQWVNAAAFTPDGKYIATISADRTAKIWDASSGELVTQPFKHQSEVVSCCFAANGQMLLTGCSDGTVSAWDVATEKLIYERNEHYVRVNSIILAPNGQTFLTGSDDHTVRQWDLRTGKRISEPFRHETAVKSVVISPDGKSIASAAQDKIVRVWDLFTGIQLYSFEHTGEVQSLAISPDGNWLVTAADDKAANGVRIWDLKTGKIVLENLRHDRLVNLVKFTPAAVWNDEKNPKKWLLTISDKTARVWDASSGKAITEPIQHTESIKAAEFSPDGNFVVTASGKTARTWESFTGRDVADPIQHDGDIRFVTFGPKGDSLLTGSADKTARLWFLRMSGRTPQWLSEFATVVCGYHLAESGATELVPDRWYKMNQLMSGLPENNNDHYTTWARWFVESHDARAAAPFAKTSLKAYVLRRVYEGTTESLQRALDFEPNNAKALVKLARLTAAPEQADFLSKIGESYDPANPEILWIRAQVLQQIYKMSDALAVMQRAIALDPHNLSSFGLGGAEIHIVNKDENYSTGWLPNGWLDNNAAVPVSVGYSKVKDLPPNVSMGFGINVNEKSRALAELKGPRFVCKRNERCTVEGWVRSLAKSDLTIALCQFIESNDRLKEQTIRTTSEWKFFKFQFVPQQDTAAELRIYGLAGAAVDLAGITVRQDQKDQN